MPCQLAPWEVEYEQRQIAKRKVCLAEEAAREVDDPRVKARLRKLATESMTWKATRATRESCAAWRMLFEIIDADDPAAAARRIADSKTLTQHRVYWEAHQVGDRANARARRREQRKAQKGRR